MFPLATYQKYFNVKVFCTGVKAKLESEAGCGMVLCADDPELLDKLSWAAEKGQSLDWIHTYSHVKYIVTFSALSNLTVSPCFIGILTFCIVGLRILLTHVEPVRSFYPD